ncbi:Z1 domain-containing protein [Phocaeicola barnesiae]|uniref:Z1 domain-containing protein n=1 Tax=Phocaeicola barnesiae TaxID=376804 RepID=UPI0025A33D61|nr:Z1 domain-containing protein [Phocaeicola barnesiae]MDM8310134.1 Z1 domain-containing protein [Phocaeicola barnesiae]
MNELNDKAINICQAIIGFKLGVSDDEINQAISDVTSIPMYAGLDKTELKKSLLAIYNVKVDTYQILEGRDARIPWLKEFKAERQSEWLFWTRYKRYLAEQKHFAPEVISQLDDLTDRILDKLFNPQRDDVIINKKGLVVGQVQSGKTANYTGLICKAADAGFNLIIILAGIHNNLRSQTQTRIDEGFLGFDTQNTRAYDMNRTIRIGVGLIPGFDNAIANSYTTSTERGDFTKQAANTAGFNFNNPQPIILVIKKNVSVLKRLYSWLKSQSTHDIIANKSLLLIDDEADNASINTSRDGDDPTAINKNICKIIKLFNRSAYVGYTATPFANIFIPLDKDDLFPKDFIINLPAPDNYIGPEKVFGTSANPDGNEDLLPIVFPVTDSDTFVPAGHKRDDPKPTIDDIPESLKTAIKCFIITCAIRIARGQENKHNSMLIHVSRFQAWQNHLKIIIDRLFKYYKSEIEANDPTIMEEFRQIFEEDTPNYRSYCSITREIMNSPVLSRVDNRMRLHTWNEIKPLLYRAVQKIEVKSINGTSGDSLTYYENEKNGISVIAIGGDKLSRGLTLEGLSVSYFLRASKMYDTLMQMGRWFGYRPGYVDLCRLFTSNELNEWYRHITLASDELREEFRYLAESGGTPENYALKVRTHPGQLQITSISKMRHTRNIQVSWAGRLVETYQLLQNSISKRNNLAVTDSLLSELGTPDRIKSDYLWTGVSSDIICDYLSRFQLPESLTKVNLDLICDYIRELNEVGELISWNIALMSKNVDKNTCVHTFSNGVQVGCFIRRQAKDAQNSKTYYIRKNHIVGNPTDEFIDLPANMLSDALDETRDRKFKAGEEWKHDYPSPQLVRQEFRSKQTPLLMIYPLNPAFSNVSGLTDTTTDTKNDEPFIGFAIAFPHSDTNKAVSYVANQVTDFAITEENFDNTNDNTYDE